MLIMAAAAMAHTVVNSSHRHNKKTEPVTEHRYLSGHGCDDMVQWDFCCTDGNRAGQWTTIGVPSCWEMQGFGTLQYGYLYDPWYSGLWKDTQRQGKAARKQIQATLPPKATEHGLYRKTFFVEKELKDKCVLLTFEGVMTDALVKVNGQQAGPVHQGAFYRFQYDVTRLLHYGAENLLEVDVAKESTRQSVNDAERHGDYWNFGGIFRPVYLEILPKAHLYDISIDARADFSLNVDYKVANAPNGYSVEQVVIGEKSLWTAETPNLCTLRLKLIDHKGHVLHQVDTRFGYRTLEVRRGDGFYLNGQKLQVRGVNRHSFRAETGRTLSPRLNEEDVRLIKSMNMNAVRLAHYPPDKDFLDACDSLGLYVMDELCSWQKPLDTEVGTQLATEMVTHDRNHPCILWWSNGNEGGWNAELDTVFHQLDPQQRPVIHPWGVNEGIDTKHYRNYYEAQQWIRKPNIYMPTEFQHGLYDGGLGAGQKAIWDVMLSGDHTAGGFLWVLSDEGVLRGDTIDCAGNLGPDGIVGPRHELGSSYYTIRQVWSPIQVVSINPPGSEKREVLSSTQLLIRNEYDFTDFSQCRLTYEYVNYNRQGRRTTVLEGQLPTTSIPPHQSKVVNIPHTEADALSITVTDSAGQELFTWASRLQHVADTSVATSIDGCPLGVTPRFVAVTATDSVVHLNGQYRWYQLSPDRYRLDYDYDYTGEVKLMGLALDYPETECRGKRWLGRGPSRVWQNRMEGPQYGYWENKYNNTRPGASFEMPEFKGYFDDVTWLEADFADYTIRLEPQSDSTFVGVFAPQDGMDNYLFNLPETGLAVLDVIPAIGNKINGAEKTGPEGKPRHVAGRHHGCVILEKIKKELRNSTLYVSSAGQVSSQRQSLYQSFLTPPDSIRVGCYYYWVNEHVDPKGVKADLQWMKDNGITLAFLATDIRNRTRWEKPWEGETFGKNKFQSKLWWKNLHTALKTAGKLGIEMGIFNCPGWSQSGGPWIKPDEAMRNWTPQGIEICKTKQGTDVSCGPCSDEAEGLEVDKLSKKHVQKHFEAFIGEILRRIPQKDRPTLTTVVVDSWERGKQNYTDSIFVKFKQRFGYELDYQNEACRKDLDRLISDLVASEYMGGLTEKAHEYGLRTWCEPYAHSPFPGNSITYGSVADEVAAEFWVNDRKYRQKEVDAAVGAARRSGKNRVWAESFTDGTWDKVAQDDWSFEKLKPIADRYFHAGINASILHVVISQPGDYRKPAVRPWFGSFFDRRSQHATDLKPLVRYLRRCNFMLQLGKPYNNATDQRIMDDGTIICFTDDSQFEITFPDGSKETWNPCK